MDTTAKQLAEQLLDGDVTEQEFLRSVARLTVASTNEANVDINRRQRSGYPEVVFGEGKTVPALVAICDKLREAGEPILVTRVDAEQASALCESDARLEYNPVARTIRTQSDVETGGPLVAVVTAGTSDLPVAEEAAETLQWMGARVTRVRDVGVAGPHRLPAHLDQLHPAKVVVVVAGMEGALPSVVAGFLSVPIIAVPTSVGYGANLGGVAALLSMLNSCAANVAVVNIDAGFKGGYLAGMIAHATVPSDQNAASQADDS